METKKITREIAFMLLHTLPFIYLFLVYNNLPDIVPTHFNLEGIADGFSQKSTLIWILLALNILGYLLFLVIPKIDPKKFATTHEKIYTRIRIGISILLVSLSGLIVYMANGDTQKGILVLAVIFAGLSIFLGNYLQAVKPNYFIGIRTPWTLNSETVWRKSHLVTGRIMFYAGVLSLLFLFFIPAKYAPFPPVIALVVSSLICIIYSFILYKNEKGKTS
jgi:uncharacterized membrane protein